MSKQDFAEGCFVGLFKIFLVMLLLAVVFAGTLIENNYYKEIVKQGVAESDRRVDTVFVEQYHVDSTGKYLIRYDGDTVVGYQKKP